MADSRPSVGCHFVAIPVLHRLVLAAKEKASHGDHSCDVDYETSRLNFNLDGVAISSKAIFVDLSTPHANQVCDFTTVIPLVKFLSIASKGSVLEGLAQAAAKKIARFHRLGLKHCYL